MAEFEMSGPGEKQISFDEDGNASIKSDKPITANPALPVLDVRVNILELASFSVTQIDSKRVIRGTYADGASFVVTIDSEAGTLETSAQHALTTLEDGADKSHTVLTFLPRTNSIKKKTH